MNNQQPLSVSQLNRQIRLFLEQDVGQVQVEGEISNLKQPGSGHYYFTLKDDTAQLRCVYFKNRHFYSSTGLQEGQQIVAQGKLSIYEARGDYQLIVENVKDAGEGQLFRQFEILKKKLAAEGLFHPDLKKPLPRFPEQIAIITSPTGAAIRDIIATLARRYPYATLLIYPSEVQGQQAPAQLIRALKQAEADQKADVIILARGGGSLEDLWAFNDEQLARQIAACSIPLVSGVGHETDFSIADFVADYRAATPTAAAESVSPDSQKLIETYQNYLNRLQQCLNHQLKGLRQRLHYAQNKLASPRQMILTHWQSLDYLERRMQQAMGKKSKEVDHQLKLLHSRLLARSPFTLIQKAQQKLTVIEKQLSQILRHKLQYEQQKLKSRFATLHAVSPLATLDRGYSISTLNDKVLYSSSQVNTGEIIKVKLAKGLLNCQVMEKEDEHAKNN